MDATQAAQADVAFRDAMARLLREPRALDGFPQARQDYVRYAHNALTWWIDAGRSGDPIDGPDELADRDRIILAWAEATEAPAKRVATAIAAQAAALRRPTN